MQAESATGQITIERAVKSRQRKHILLGFTVLCLGARSPSIPFQAVLIAVSFLGLVHDIQRSGVEGILFANKDSLGLGFAAFVKGEYLLLHNY